MTIKVIDGKYKGMVGKVVDALDNRLYINFGAISWKTDEFGYVNIEEIEDAENNHTKANIRGEGR